MWPFPWLSLGMRSLKSTCPHGCWSNLFLRTRAECFARLSHGLGVCPPVRPSITLLYCIKMVQARITKSSLWAALRTSFLWQNMVMLGEGVSLKRGHQNTLFLPLLEHLVWKQLQIGTDMVLVITSSGHELFSSDNIDDLEPPKEAFLANIFLQFLNDSAHISRVNKNGKSERQNGWR